MKQKGRGRRDVVVHDQKAFLFADFNQLQMEHRKCYAELIKLSHARCEKDVRLHWDVETMARLSLKNIKAGSNSDPLSSINWNK